MDIGKGLGELVGIVFGSTLGPVGAVVGKEVGGGVGDAIGDLFDNAPAQVDPVVKPVVKSKTMWFNLLLPLAYVVLQWGVGLDLESYGVSPMVAVIFQSIGNVILRFMTVSGIGKA